MSGILNLGGTPTSIIPPRTRDLGDPGFWREFAPGLRVEDARSVQALEAITPSPDDMVMLRTLMVEEGYFQASNIAWPMDIDLMANTVRALDRAGLPAVFAFLYDEFWIPFYRLQPIYAALLGDYKMLPDFWVWNVDPARGDAGWRPHRDKGHMSLFPDGMPKSITTWMPLSRATPLNGCMYIVPATQDPTYNTPDDKDWRFEHAGIRALPAEAGDVFMWNQAVLHWGSRTSPRGGASRVSMAFEFQRADVPPYNQPLLPPLEFHPFAARLRLIAKQILQDPHMYKVDPMVERIAHAVIAAPA